jgi:hypothetical protein
MEMEPSDAKNVQYILYVPIEIVLAVVISLEPNGGIKPNVM